MKSVAIIIVNWNGGKYLPDCLESIKHQTCKDFDIILVDNASSDDSLEIAKKYKDVAIIKNDKNYGFAKGNNIGVRKALRDGYKYVVLVNNDTEADRNWLAALVSLAEKDPKFGAIQSKILLADSGLINTAGGELHYLGFGYCGHYKEVDNFSETSDICVASGASVLLRASVLKDVGLFDESFFMYAEDADLSWRIKAAGYKIAFEPKSVIYHKYSFSKNKNKFYYAERNRLIFVIKNYDAKTFLLLSPAFLVTELAMILFAAMDGWLMEKIRGYKYIVRNFSKIIASRTGVQKIKKIRDSDLKKNFVSTLFFEEVNSPLIGVANLFFSSYWFFIRGFI